jgi:hypothetical protein
LSSFLLPYLTSIPSEPNAPKLRHTLFKIPGLFRVFIFWYRERRFAATIRRDVTMHVIQALKAIPDPRRRHGRRCPLVSLLAIVLRAAMPLVRRCRG